MVEQVGGDHYKADYQHWDWVAETGLGYLEGNATKYLARWRKKNGRQDLEKALSYIQKLLDIPGLTPARERLGYSPLKLQRFLRASGLDGTYEGDLITRLDSWRVEEDLSQVVTYLKELINGA